MAVQAVIPFCSVPSLRSSLSLHCVFPLETEHLLARTRFTVEAVYGNFFREALTDESSELIWIARGAGTRCSMS